MNICTLQEYSLSLDVFSHIWGFLAMDHEVSVYQEPGTRFWVFQAGYLMQSSWQVCDVGADSIQPPKSSEPTPSINASYRQNFPLWGLFPWRTLTNVCPRCQIFCLVFRHNPHSQWLNSFQVTPTFPHLALIQREKETGVGWDYSDMPLKPH